jgi:hypothetical protein
VVHGDVTPANILIDQSGTPMLVDFGLALTPGQTSLGGTPGYMAPEAAAGQAVDKRSDVYSSCVVLAELLKGARLFPESSLAATHRQRISTPKLDGIEAPVAAVLSTGLDTAPDKRHPDAAVLLADLEEAIEESRGRGWIAGAGLGAIGSTAATIAAGTAMTGTATTGTASAGTSTATTASKSGTSTLSRGKVIGATAAAVVIAIFAFLLLRPSPPPLTAARTTTSPPAAAGAAQAAQATIDGTYIFHYSPMVCGSVSEPMYDKPLRVVQQGDSLNFDGATGPLNADGSFVLTSTDAANTVTIRGNVATEGGRTVISGERKAHSNIVQISCDPTTTFTGTKQ